ncbi:hypothetical protein Tco_1507762 [Tanacetum coccineum]|uniref:Uncharacterized protein n=1 Tax=Tanacetum coccineum TaxID=301880 RepID=A0ABQ5B3Z4_9ASTR
MGRSDMVLELLGAVLWNYVDLKFTSRAGGDPRESPRKHFWKNLGDCYPNSGFTEGSRKGLCGIYGVDALNKGLGEVVNAGERRG